MAKKKRSTPGINGSSSADIAFMLLIFFLITTSMDTDKGLLRRLPPLAPKQQNNKPVEINDRNLMRLLVNRNNEIVIFRKVGGVDQLLPVSLDQLKDKAVEFILNPNNDPSLAERETREVLGLGKRNVVLTGYAISIKNEVETSYQVYVSVQNELLKAYNEIWNGFAKQEFGKEFDALTVSQQKSVTDAYPLHISEMPLSNLVKK